MTNAVDQYGYLGIAILMFAENVFPPIPSELIMPLAGFTAATGEMSLALVIVAGSAGSLAGALLWYYVGLWLGCDRLKRWAARHGHWMTISPREVDTAAKWFNRHGGMAVFLGRLAPAVRTLISVPAGVAEMGLVRFLLFSAVGTVIWTALLAGAGYMLKDRYDQVSGYVQPAGNAIIAVLVLWYVYRVITYRRRRPPRSSTR